MNVYIEQNGDNVLSDSGFYGDNNSLLSESSEEISSFNDASIYTCDVSDYLRNIDGNLETLVQNESIVSETVEDFTISDLNKTLQWTNVLIIILILYIVGRSISNRVRLL